MSKIDTKTPQDAISGPADPADATHNVGFSVSISATGFLHSQCSDGDESSGGGSSESVMYVHAISVSQPYQSWTVIRTQDDFETVSQTLLCILPNLPPCPTVQAPMPGLSAEKPDEQEQLVNARSAMQEYLMTILHHPYVRDSQALRQFLTINANIIPSYMEGVRWLTFQQAPATENPPDNSAVNNTNNHTTNSDTQRQNHSLDEMEMDDMFDGPGDYHEDDDNTVSEDENDESDRALPYNVRYPPTEEAITEEDSMEIFGCSGEIEMIDDVGSLAQSLGASHLGRSLQLQAQIAKDRGDVLPCHNQPQSQGLPVGGIGQASLPPVGGVGGIGDAMRAASECDNSTDNKIEGLGDSFHQYAPVSPPRLDSFKMIKVIGKGSFGKVFLVREIKTEEMFALKVLKKDNIIKRNQVEHTKTERNVLGYVRHPFIVGLNMAFQSNDKLYFVLDYCAGGELFFHLGKLGKFPEPRARFYAAEIILAITYVHELDIIYRDLKPENVLLDSKGHVRLTDFGLSKEGITGSASGANSFCGTPEYLAPEILNRQGHGRAVDWWSLGALLYEMLTGLPPFYCRDREKLFEKIRKSDLNYPRYLSSQAISLLKGLLTREPLRRLGSGPDDAKEIEKHPFFEEVEWDKLSKGDVPPPWDPQIGGSLDTSQFDNEFTSMPMFSPQSVKHGFGTTPQDNTFEGFTFTDKTFYHPPNE